MKTTTEASVILRVTIGRVQQLCQQGRLLATKQGRDWLINEESLRQYRPRPNGRPPQQRPPVA